ncbi:MAG: hypothetical protein ACJ74G_23005 [Blastocatellia bacterium]
MSLLKGDKPNRPMTGDQHAEPRFPVIEIENATGVSKSDGSNQTAQYNRPPAAYMEYVWQLGWTDGRISQPTEANETILKSQAELEWLEELAVTEQQTAQAEAKVAFLQSRCDRVQLRLKQLQQVYDELRQVINQRTHDRSFLLAVIYLGAAALLMLADIPLSLTLVARGFDMKTEVEDLNTGEVGTVKDLLTKPYLTITHLWEPLIMATGIALSGIFIKYFMDEVLFREETPQADMKRFYRRRSFWRTIILSGLFIGFLWTIVVLGFFRADIQRQEKLYALRTQVSIDGTNRHLSEQQINQNYEAAKQELLEKDKWAELAFISLTLMFPVAGGICFSAGWRRLEKTRPYLMKSWVVGFRRWRNARLYDKWYHSWTKAQAEWVALSNRLSREQRKGEIVAALRTNLYKHGYERGQTVPDTVDAGLSLYDRCRKSLNKLLARDVNAEVLRKDKAV